MVGQEEAPVEVEHLVEPAHARRQGGQRVEHRIHRTEATQLLPETGRQRGSEDRVVQPEEVARQAFGGRGGRMTEKLGEAAAGGVVPRQLRAQVDQGLAPGRRHPTPVALGCQRLMPAIAGEDIVAAGAGKQDLHAPVARGGADRARRESRGIRGRLVQAPDQLVELIQAFLRETHHVQRDAEARAHQARVGQVIGEAFGLAAAGIQGETRVVGAAGEVPDRVVRDGGGIDPAGKEPAERDIRDQLPTHRLRHVVTTRLHGGGARESLHLLPVMPGGERREADGAVLRALEEVAGPELADAAGRRALPGRIEQGQVGGDGMGIRRQVDARHGEQGLQFRGKRETRRGPRPVERLHAGRVPREQEAPLIGEPGGEGEDPVQPWQAPAAMARQQFDEHLGIARTAQRRALALQPGPEFPVVVDLAVEDQRHPAARIGHRLMPGRGKVEDRQADVREADATGRPDALPVRPPMGLGLVHPRQEFRREITEVSRDAAHAQRARKPSS